MDTQLHDELDRSFGTGPTPLPLEETLSAGRRALRRRRRRGLAAGLVAVAAVTAVGVWQVQPEPRTEAPVATPGQDDADRDLWRDLDPIPQFEHEGTQAFYDADGVMVVRPEATVEQQLEDPRPVVGVDRTVALVTRMEGQAYWSVLYWRQDQSGGSSSVRPEEARGATYDEWVDAEAALVTKESLPDEWVTFAADGSLRPVRDARIVAQTGEVPGRIAPAGSTAAVAMLTIDDAQVCAYARTIGDRDPEYIYLNGAQLGGDLAGCVDNMGGWDPDVPR